MRPHLSIAVLDDHEDGRVLALHGPVQGLDAHAVLGRAERQRPWVADGPRGEVPGQLHVEKHLSLNVILDTTQCVQPKGTMKSHTASPDLCCILGVASRTPDDDHSMLSTTTVTAQ